MINQLSQSSNQQVTVAQQRQKFYQHRGTIAAAGLLVSSTVGIILALWQQADLRHQAKTADAMLAENPVESLILAIQATGQNRLGQFGQLQPEVESSLLKAVQTAKEQNRFNFENRVDTVAFSPDGQTIAAAGESSVVHLWNVQGSPQPNLESHRRSIRAITFSSDGRTLVGTPQINSGELMQMWDLPSRALYQTPPEAQVLSTAFSPDRQYGVSGTIDGRVFLWNRQGHSIAQLAPIQNAKVTAVVWNGNTIGSGSADGTISLWNLKGEALGRLQVGASVVSMNLSQDSQRFIAQTTQGQQAFLWNSAVGQWQPISLSEAGNTSAADLSPDDATIARGYPNGKVQLLSLSQPNQPFSRPFLGHQGTVTAVQFSPDGSKLLSGGQDGTVRLWDLQDGTLANRSQIPAWENPTPTSIALSANGQRLILRNPDGSIRLSDKQGNVIRQFNNPTPDPIQKTAVSGDGKSIALYSDSGKTADRQTTGQIVLLDTDTKAIRLRKPLSEPITAIALNQNGKQMVTVNRSGSVSLWDAQGNAIGQSPDTFAEVSQVAFSPKQTTVAIGSQQGTVRFWNWQTDQVSAPIKVQSGSITSIAFRPDGKTIVSGSANGALQLSSIEGKLIGYPLLGHRAAVRSVAFSVDGKQVISLSQDGEIRRWQANWEAWLTTACRRLQDHILLQNPTTAEAQTAKLICQTQVWGLTNANKRLTLRAMSPYLSSLNWRSSILSQETRLIVKRGERRVYVYHGSSLQATYPIAVGQPGWETPIGKFHVTQMLRDPAWTHPMTREVFPAGQGNPLGDRWIAFWTDGNLSVGFHGTPDRESVGQPASHGCLRMLNEDVRSLYNFVQLGTMVRVEP